MAEDAIPGSRHWRTIPFTPADDPFRSLANALVRDRSPEERGRIVADLLAQFDEPERGLRYALETWFADTAESLLLFVDQFEELFTHAPSLRSDAAAREKYDNLEPALTTSSAPLDSDGAGRVADRLTSVLESPQAGGNPRRLSFLGTTFAALSARMETKDVASLAMRLLETLENPREPDSDRRARLS